MKTEVAASESQVIQKDDDLYPSDTIAEQAVNQHALLKHPESMDKKEEDISEEVYISPETTDESIKACLPETGIKLKAPSITSVDYTQNTHDDIRHEIPSVEKGDMELILPVEQEAEIIQTSLQECSSIKMNDSMDNDSEVIDVDHEKNEINAETSQISSMLLKPDIKETAEHVSGEMEEENLSEQILPPLKEKSIEQPFHEESREVGDISAQLKAEDDSSMKTTEIQEENKHIPLTADPEDKSPQDLSYEKESDNERLSPEDAQQISEEISEIRNVSCADEEAELISEPQQSYQEILEPSQIICEGANDSKENANENSSEREVTTSTEEVLVDSSSTIEHSSKKIESEIYESKTVRSEDGAYVDQLAEHARIEAIEKSSQVGLAAVTGPANIQENDEHQTCQTEVEENETVSEMIKQNQIFPESDSQEKNVISTESISYDNANMTNVALEGDNNEKVELKAEETGYRFEEQNVETATREPYSRDQISSTDEISVPFSVKGDSAISTDSDKISSLNDNGNMESIDTEAKLDMMQEVENKREIVVETASDDITEEINDESYTVSQNQVDNLTNKATDEPSLIIDSRQNITLLAEDQISKLADVKEKEYESEEEKNSTEEENESIPSPDKDTENDFESNNEDIQNDSKPGQTCVNEPDIVKNLDTVNSDIEETKLDQGEQNQENSIQIDAIGIDGDAHSTFTNIEPSPENNNVEDVELCTTRNVTSAEEKLEDSTNSAAAENNVTSEASINKGDEPNEKQSLSVTCVQSRAEAEDTINKADDSEKEIDLQYTEPTQSTRDATVESFPNAITDETEDDKNLENTDADPSQQHDETNTKNSNYDEESNEYKDEQEPSESTEFHLEDESNMEEAKNQVYEGESCSNKEGNNGTVEVSQSQDECSKVYEDSIHVIEVEETTDKQPEEQEDRSPYSEHGGVLADQVKAMNTGINSQNENELNTSNLDGVHVQEDQTERESCKYDEKDESDTRKDKEIISQEFEQDKLVNPITSQESAPPIEPPEHNLGAAMGDPTVSQLSEIVDDEALSFEASQAVGLEAEEHIQTDEDPEQENNISADTEFQEMNVNTVELGEHIGTESDNIEMKNGGRDDEGKVLVTDPKIEGEISTGIPSQSGKLDQEINADNPVKSQDEGTEKSSEIMQVVDIQEDVSADCPVSAKEVVNQVLHLDPGTDLQQENERNTASLDYMQVQENQGGMDELHSEKDEELINQGFEQDSLGSEMPCQETSATIEALRQDLGTAMDDHTLNEPSEIANDKVHIEVSKEADLETDQHNQTNEEPEHENEISAEESMDVENHEFIPESAELREVNNTVDEAMNSRAADLNSKTAEDLSGNENTNSEISEMVKKLDEDPEVYTEVMPQDMSVENRELVPESVEQAEEKNTENEAINSIAEELGSNTIEDSGNENTDLEISQKEINTEVVLEDMDVENHNLIPELREEINAENGAIIDSRAADLGSNTVEDLNGTGNDNTHSEISQKVAELDEDPRVNTEVMHQDLSVENRELVPESVEITEENNPENEAVNSRAEDLGSNMVGDSGNENTNLEISQTAISLNKNPVVNREVVLQVMDVENHGLIPELTEVREENNTENDAIKRRGEDLGSNSFEDLTGYENTNSEIPQKEINSDENPTVNTEIVPRDIEVENHELIPESTELKEESNADNEEINIRPEDDLSGNENTSSEISQKVTDLDEDPKLDTEIITQGMKVENHGFISESTELEENSTENEAVDSIAKALGSNSVEELGGNQNTNSEISQNEINLDEDPKVDAEVVLQDMSIEDREIVPESAELTEENSTENEAIKSRAEDLGLNTVEDSGNENKNLEISKREISLNENPIVITDDALQDIDIESHELIPESTELREENSKENEVIECRPADLGSNAVEDLSRNEDTNLEISQNLTNLDEEKNTEVMPQVMDVENLEVIPESPDIRKENNPENETINGRGEDLGSNTIEDLTQIVNTNLEISQREMNSEEDPTVIKEIVPQDMDVENHELIPESAEVREENNTENEAINSKAGDLGSNTVEDLSGNENTNSEMSQKVTNLDEDPRVDTEVVPQDVDVGGHEIIPESTELRVENNTEDEATNSRSEDLGSTTMEDLSGNENTNSEISQREINLDEDSIVNTGVMPKEMNMENHEFIQELIELREENNTENEAINSKADDLGSKTIEDTSGKENTNLEISQKEISLNEDPIVETEGVPQNKDVENHKLIPDSTEVIEENKTENEAINSKAEDLGPNTAGDLGGDENTNSVISQREINLDEDPIVKTIEKIQDGEETENTVRESTQEGSQHTLAEERTIDQEKSVDTADASQLENEEKTCMYDGQIQEVKETHEQCKINEMNESESVPFKNTEIESQGFEDDCTSKQMHSEAFGQNVGAEMPNQDNEECRIDASEVNNTEEVAEHEEHRNEAIVDVSYEQEVICTNASSSGKEMDTGSSEVKNDETLLLAEQTAESPPGISQTNNAEDGPEQGIHEQSIRRNEDDELDSNKTKINMETVVNSVEHKDDREPEGPNHLASQDYELNRQPTVAQPGNEILTAIEPGQYIQELEPNDSKQEECVSNATKSYIDGHSVDEMTPHETVQTQGKQPVEPQKNFLEPSSPSEATNTTQNTEDCSVTMQDLSEEKEEDSTPEKATQRELQLSSGFDLCGEDLPYIPAVEEVSKTEEYLVPEIQGAHDPQNNEMEPRSCTNNYSHEISSDGDQFQNNSQQTGKVSCADDSSIRPISENYGHTSEEVTENQEETKSTEQLIGMNNEEQTIEDITDGRGHQAVKSEMTVEENLCEEDYGPHATSAYDSTEEKLVPAGSVEIIERSSEPGLYKESKKVEDDIMEEKEETNADTESHEPEFYEIDNDADKDGKTLSNTECSTKSDDSKEISEEPNISVTSTSLEGEAVREIFQQNISGQKTENEVRPMEPKMDASELLHQMNVPKPDNMDIKNETQQKSVPEDVSSREVDSDHSEVKSKLEEIPSEGIFTNASDVHMDCQEADKVSAAEIIANHICQEIEAEDKLQQLPSEHQKQRPETSTLVTGVNDNALNEDALHDESTENSFMSFDNPAETICAPAEREIEHPSLEAEPSSDSVRLNVNSVRTDPDELSSEFQGVESSAEVESDTENSTLERLNIKEVCPLNEKRETDEYSELNSKSQPISGDNLVNSCETSTESFEPVIELQSEKLAISEEIGNDAQLQTVKNEIMGESNPSTFQVYEAVATDAAGEEKMQDVNTTIPSEDRALVQHPLPVPTTKSSDEIEKPLIADEHSENTTFSVSQVSAIDNTPPTETLPTEEKVSEQLMKKVSNQDSNMTQTMQIDKEEQLQGNYDDLHQPSRLQELCCKDSVNMRIDEPVDTVDVIYNGMNVKDFSKEGSESNTNEAASLQAMQSVTTRKEEITARKHEEAEKKPMLSSIIGETKGGEEFTVTQNQQEYEKNAVEEPKTEKEKEDTENEHGEEDSELKPMISSRDVEKTQNKKSQHILSGMGSKMKNSISKVKKAMACASPQFSPDEVIIKLNKSKKS